MPSESPAVPTPIEKDRSGWSGKMSPKSTEYILSVYVREDQVMVVNKSSIQSQFSTFS